MAVDRGLTARRALRLAVAAAVLVAAIPAAAVELNSASQADLEALKGIGPTASSRILAERSRRRFADWSDFAARVPGVGPATARRLSEAGLTIDGAAYPAAPPASAASASR